MPVVPQYAVLTDMNRKPRLGSVSSATGEPSAANAVGSSSSTTVASLSGQPRASWESSVVAENEWPPPPTTPPSFQK